MSTIDTSWWLFDADINPFTFSTKKACLVLSEAKSVSYQEKNGKKIILKLVLIYWKEERGLENCSLSVYMQCAFWIWKHLKILVPHNKLWKVRPHYQPFTTWAWFLIIVVNIYHTLWYQWKPMKHEIKGAEHWLIHLIPNLGN